MQLKECYVISYDSFKYSPKYAFEIKSSRPTSTFFIIKKGTYRYTFNEQTLYAYENDLVYVPRGGTYKYEVLTPVKETFLQQVEFQIFDTETSSEMSLTDIPTVAVHNCNQEITELMEELTSSNVCANKYNVFKHTGIINMLIYYMALNCDSLRASKIRVPIAQVLEYISRNLDKPILISKLAEISHLSPVPFRRVFEQEISCSPKAYVTNLKIKKACSLLQKTDKSIGEIAILVGYENVYYFSNVFKKETNFSPTAYRNKFSL